MRITVESDGKTIVYDENVISGKKSVSVNGEQAVKQGKNLFSLSTGERLTLKGNLLSGASIYINGREVVLFKNKWYEWILIFLPFLYLALGIFGGAIGGGLSALFACLAAYINAGLLRGDMNVPTKVICCLVVAVVFFFVWFGLYVLIVGGLAAAFPSIFE